MKTKFEEKVEKRKFWHEFIKKIARDAKTSENLPTDIGFSMELISVNTLAISFNTAYSQYNNKDSYDLILDFIIGYEVSGLTFSMSKVEYRDNSEYDVMIAGNLNLDTKELDKKFSELVTSKIIGESLPIEDEQQLFSEAEKSSPEIKTTNQIGSGKFKVYGVQNIIHRDPVKSAGEAEEVADMIRYHANQNNDEPDQLFSIDVCEVLFMELDTDGNPMLNPDGSIVVHQI
jgi:hypothetical protein